MWEISCDSEVGSILRTLLSPRGRVMPLDVARFHFLFALLPQIFSRGLRGAEKPAGSWLIAVAKTRGHRFNRSQRWVTRNAPLSRSSKSNSTCQMLYQSARGARIGWRVCVDEKCR